MQLFFDWHLKSLATWLFAQHFFQAGIKETSKFQITGPLWGESTATDDRWIPLTKGQ